MKRDSLRRPANQPKREAGLTDTVPGLRNDQDNAFSNFKKSSKATSMLNEIRLPKLGIAELRKLARSQGITENNASEIRDQIIHKAFTDGWTLNRLKDMVRTLTSWQEFRMRKDSHTDKVINKLASENKELKKEIKVIKKQISKQDLKIEVVNEKVEGNAEQIGNFCNKLENVSDRVHVVEVMAKQNHNIIKNHAEQNLIFSKNVDAAFKESHKDSTNVIKAVHKLSKITSESLKRTDALEKENTKRKLSVGNDELKVTFSNVNTKRSKCIDTNSTSTNENRSPERRIEDPDVSSSAARRSLPVKKSTHSQREKNDDRPSSRIGKSSEHYSRSSTRSESSRSQSSRNRSTSIQSRSSRTARIRSRSPSSSTRNTSSNRSSLGTPELAQVLFDWMPFSHPLAHLSRSDGSLSLI